VTAARKGVGPEWMTRDQVAAYLDVTVRTVARYIETGELRAYKRGPRAVRIKRSDVDAMFREIPPHPHEHHNGNGHR
jgi:excisionase family DNA binding protein